MMLDTYSIDRAQQAHQVHQAHQAYRGFFLEGQRFSREQIFALAAKYGEEIGHRADLFRFLAEWFADSPTVCVQTSGSTGVPKLIEVEKIRMIQSACLTCSALGLRSGDKALLCMPLQFIGAKMLLVRALLADLDLYCVAPSVQPLRDLDTEFAFVPMTPQQAWGCLETPAGEARLRKVRHVLLGGTTVSAELQARLADFPHAVWSSYGMTETLSHIALRKLNGADASDYFTPFAGVELSLSDVDTLIIQAPLVCKDVLTTTDIAELLPDGRFLILGRADNVINSGGIKIQIEAIEAALLPHFSQAFQITALPDAQLGEQVVLLLDEAHPDWEAACSHLPQYWKPKQSILIPALPYTESGKPDRCQARVLAKVHAVLM